VTAFADAVGADAVKGMRWAYTDGHHATLLTQFLQESPY
jgi:hypothetical protein